MFCFLGYYVQFVIVLNVLTGQREKRDRVKISLDGQRDRQQIYFEPRSHNLHTSTISGTVRRI